VKKFKNPKYYSACKDCWEKRGGWLPGNGNSITVSMGDCPYCKTKEATLIPWVDFNWPDDGMKDIRAKLWRD
jgi:hypothetical protein